jgi:hypothetical protein
LDRRLGETLINSGHSGLEEKYPNAHAKEWTTVGHVHIQ